MLDFSLSWVSSGLSVPVVWAGITERCTLSHRILSEYQVYQASPYSNCAALCSLCQLGGCFAGSGYAGISGALACLAIFVGLARKYYSSHFFCEDQKPKKSFNIALTTWGKTIYEWGKRLPFRMHTPPKHKIFLRKRVAKVFMEK